MAHSSNEMKGGKRLTTKDHRTLQTSLPAMRHDQLSDREPMKDIDDIVNQGPHSAPTNLESHEPELDQISADDQKPISRNNDQPQLRAKTLAVQSS